MQMAGIILKQTITMGLYMLMGFTLYRTGKLTKEGSRCIATMLLWLVLPVVIIRSFLKPFSMDNLSALGFSFLLGGVAHAVAMLLGWLFYRRDPLDCFSSAFSNVGFMGIPLVTAIFGPESPLYLCGLVVFVNFFQWTWGASLLRKEKKPFVLKDALLNPMLLAPMIGFAIFITGLGSHLPSVVTGALDGVAALNGPLAMIVLGVYLAQTEFKTLVTTRKLYLVSAVRLLIIPLATLLVLALVPVSRDIRLIVLLGAAAPVGSNVAVYAQLYNSDYPYACQTVALSTIFSILSLPLIMQLANMIL
ncbi:MAG: AEC family transporter [Clostridia bacterium]|nr:AEC family transporter [Clostridia bacterium]MBQ2947494.1 AEC family transporter [Clostridia bacterium]